MGGNHIELPESLQVYGFGFKQYLAMSLLDRSSNHQPGWFIRTICVQFACKWYGNYGHNGQYGQSYGRIVDRVDTMDAITLCGQGTVILLIRLLQVRVLPGVLTIPIFDGNTPTDLAFVSFA